MASSSSKSSKLEVTINYDGVFGRPIEYLSGLVNTQVFEFEHPDYSSFCRALKKVTRKLKFVLYYVVPHKKMCGGLRLLKCDEDMIRFIEHGLRNGGKITIYLDGYDDDLSEYLGEDTIDSSKEKEKQYENVGVESLKLLRMDYVRVLTQ